MMEPTTKDILTALTAPQDKYGEVPFYWWSGDALNRDRISSQLKKLHANGVAGVQINYAHDYKNNGEDGNFGGHGRSLKGSPEQFSDSWWDFFTFAARECEKLGMGIGVGDYTIAWIGNGYFTDKIASDSAMNAENLICERKIYYDDTPNTDNDTLAVIGYTDSEYSEPVIYYEKGKTTADIPLGSEIFIIKTQIKPMSVSPLNPDCGRELVKIYFEEFERRIPDLKKGTLNYFFQDELMFNCDIKTLWRSNLRDGIQEKYGYDVLGYLPHLFFSLGKITPKIRLDIADVKTSIIEESYFKPIYSFHASRGMIYGCDQSSRGKDPGEFSDYFRTVRWFTAPGNDTPGRAADLIKVKVNSSIAHLYKRPRVWLEAYHSSGWGTTLESITAPTSDNFIFGANLLNLHGLYYSTNGGFFEWAPPDFHFRMPYWDDEKYWLLKYKRLSALLTLGTHRCDAAVYYPVSSCDYGENAEECVKSTFETAELIYNRGIDFDFIDFQSIDNAQCKNGKLHVADEQYRVLIFCDTDIIRYSNIKKIKEFLDCGGAVVFYGITPYMSNRAGADDAILNSDIMDILSHPSSRLIKSGEELLNFINTKVTRSFLPEFDRDKKTYVNHRVHGKNDIFFVRYAAKDSVCRFEATGAPYLIDTDCAKIYKLNGTIAQDGFIFIKMPNEANADSVFLFTDDYIEFDGEINTSGFSTEEEIRRTELNGEWNFELQPTLDNTDGDFYLPGGGMIGPQARFFNCTEISSEKVFPEHFRYTDLPYCESMRMRQVKANEKTYELCRLFANDFSLVTNEIITFGDTEYNISSQHLHDRYGYIYTGDEYMPGLTEQGHHGLKGKIFDDNMYFDSDSVFLSQIICDEDCTAFITLCGITPDYLFINGCETDIRAKSVMLHSGTNDIVTGFIYDENKADSVRNTSRIKRSGLYFTKSDKIKNTDIPLAKCDFANDSFLPSQAYECSDNLFCYNFISAPGFMGFSGNFFGTLLSAYSDGIKMEISSDGNGNFSGRRFSAKLSAGSPHPTNVTFFVKADAGHQYTGAIPEPLELDCDSSGLVLTGNLAETGALCCYSGKAVYSTETELEKIATDERFILEISDAAATLSIEVNSKLVAVFTYKPFVCDITDFVVNGTNKIKITVSNTLCNHYSTVPSRYSNYPDDFEYGITGKVIIKVLRK